MAHYSAALDNLVEALALEGNSTKEKMLKILHECEQQIIIAK